MGGSSSAEKGPILSRQRVVLASHNAGKVRELGAALHDTGWELVGMDLLGLTSPEETGTTFEANATIKAEAAACGSGLWALADDSGLEVDALNGAPGVATADFGGWQRLLEVMTDLPTAPRTARFICALALVRDGFETVYFRGVCEGSIAVEGQGEGGFGYDPVFIPQGDTRTFAEMTAAEKAALSHRGKAVQTLLAWAAAHRVEFSGA